MYIRHNSPHFVKNIPQVFKTDPKGIAVRPKNSLNVEVITRHDRNFIIACPSVPPCPTLDLLGQGWLKIWIWQRLTKFLSRTPSWISKNGTNIIQRSIKNTYFSKASYVWLKNCACHAHLKFKFQKGVAGTIF